MANMYEHQQNKGASDGPTCDIPMVSPTTSPSPTNPDPHGIYIDEVQGHTRRLRKLINFTHSSTKAAGIMLLAAIAALIIANSSLYQPFLDFWHTEVGISVGSFYGEMTFVHIINDILMAIFFLLVGLEIKYEMTVGELTNIRQAALPILGAVGGVLMPIVIYLLCNMGNSQTIHGWGVPTATDIAFALGILALLGSRVPNGVKVFLSTLAVADDIIAILVIAIFYGEAPDLFWLCAAAFVFAALVLTNRMHIFALTPYIVLGIFLWFSVFMSGIHSTIAGVLLAVTIPSGSSINMKNFLRWSDERIQLADTYHDEDTPLIAQKKYLNTVSNLSSISRKVIPPAVRLENGIYPWVYFFILPLFAFTNADVSFVGDNLVNMFTSPVIYGIFFGLLLGKPIGIMIMSFACVKLGIGKLPENVNWHHMLGASILGGVGFTMAIFVANLAYENPLFVTEAKLAILSASLVAGIIGFVLLFTQAKETQEHTQQ